MRTFRIVALVFGLLSATAPLAETGGALRPGQPAQGRLNGSSAARYSLAATPGDYLRGTLSSPDGSRFGLDLVDRDGRHLRRLVDAAEGNGEFHFVMPQEAGALRLTARDGGSFRLAIDRLVPVDAQVAPEPAIASPRIAALAKTLAAGGSTDGFWAEIAVNGAPLVEPAADGNVLLTFLARGARRNVRLLAAPSGDHENLNRLGRSDVWFRSFTVPASTRMSYQLAYDVPEFDGSARDRRLAILATAKADPLNPHGWPADAIDAYARESTVELAGAPPQPWDGEQGNPQGRLSGFSFESAALGNRRDITLYYPPGFDAANPANVLMLVFDAKDYLGRVATPLILDNMIAAGVIPPVVAAFIANPDRPSRARELPANPVFADVLAEALLPRIAAETGMKPGPARTVLAGSSYGGLAAATVALRHPERFGNAISLSGSFWWSPPGTPAEVSSFVASPVAAQPRAPVRFFLSAGLFEAAKGGTGGILETSRHLRDVLCAKGYDVAYREYAGGHDYFVWKGAVADGLVALFGR